MLHEQAQELERLSKKVNDARQELVQLEKNKKQFLLDREAEAEALLKDVKNEIDNANKILEKKADLVDQHVKELTGVYAKFEKGLSSLLDTVWGVVDSLTDIMKKTQKTEGILASAIDYVKKLTGQVSEEEKELKKEKKRVTLKDKKADAKLEEAENLAYWHKSGKRYTQK